MDFKVNTIIKTKSSKLIYLKDQMEDCSITEQLYIGVGI